MAKKSAQLVIPVRSTFQNDLHPPTGGPHPVLYFTTQITKKYCTAMCYQEPILQKFQHCCLCPLPKIKENRNTHFMVLCYKSICPNSKAAGLVQRAVCNVQPHNRMQCHGFYFFSLCRKDSPAFLLCF